MSFASQLVVPVLGSLARAAHRLEQPWDRARGAAALARLKRRGAGCDIQGHITTAFPGRIELGDRVTIGKWCYFFGSGGITLGDDVAISRRVTIYSGSHRYEGDALPFDLTYESAPVTIERNAWVGMNVNILPGVTLGEGCIVGMGATVSKSVEPGTIVVGGPTRVVGRRDDERYRRLVAEGKHFMDLAGGGEQRRG